jgi:hypothetical protein
MARHFRFARFCILQYAMSAFESCLPMFKVQRHERIVRKSGHVWRRCGGAKSRSATRLSRRSEEGEELKGPLASGSVTATSIPNGLPVAT